MYSNTVGFVAGAVNVSKAGFSARSYVCCDVNGWSGAGRARGCCAGSERRQWGHAKGAGFPKSGLCLSLAWDVPGHQLAPETLLFGGENRLQSRDRVKKRKINKVSFSCSTTGGFELEAAPEGLWSNLLL